MRIAFIALAASIAATTALARQDTIADPFAGLGFQGPECVRYDSAGGSFLVSNVNGEFTDKDDNGFISRVPTDGGATLKWISGSGNDVTLNAPKGMEIANGRLYVADVDHLRVFDLASGKALGAVEVPDAEFLNGVAVGRDGPIYVTDSGTKEKPGAVYAITGESTVEAITDGSVIPRPNGIGIDAQGNLWVVAYGGDTVYVLSPEGEVLEKHQMPSGQLDGLVVRPDGSVLVSSWKGHSVMRIKPDGAVQTLVTGLTQPACFTVAELGGTESLLIPQVKANAVAVVALSDTPVDLGRQQASGQGQQPQPARQAQSGSAQAGQQAAAAQSGGMPGTVEQSSGQPQDPRTVPADNVAPSPGSGAGGLSTRVSAKHGPYIVNGDGRALYLFEPEKPDGDGSGAEIECTDTCTRIFLPVIASAAPRATGQVKPDLTGTIQRPDGSTQATYGGWPLYTYRGDRGEGMAAAADFGKPQFGGEWHLVGPDGKPAAETMNANEQFSKLDLKAPECVRYNAEGRYYLISNVNGGLTAKDNNGFITRVDKAGLSELKWIEGGKNGVTLNGPKGMEIDGGRLYVADVAHVRIFDLSDGKPLGAIEIPEAQMLNDIVFVGGALYVTDTGTKAGKPGGVYRVADDGSITQIVPGRVIPRPDGIDADSQGRLHVTPFAGDHVYTVSTEGEVLDKTKLDTGQLDGIIVRPNGEVLASSWNGHDVVRIDGQGEPQVVVTGVTSPACFDVEDDGQQAMLLIPELQQNRIAVAPLMRP